MPSEDVAEFGGWPRPPRWVWAVAGVAAVAVLAGGVVARTEPRHATSSPRSRSRTLAVGSSARWPSAAGACGSTAYLPQVHFAQPSGAVPVRVLVGGTGLQQVAPGGLVSRPLPGMPDHGLVTNLVAGPGSDYAFDAACSSSSDYLKVYRIVAGAAHRLRTTAEYLLGGPRHAWAVTYLAQYTLLAPELTPLNGGRAVTLKTSTDPVADTAAGLVVVVHHERAGAPDTVELVDPKTGALVRRLAEGSPVGAAGHILLVLLPGCGAPLTHRTCTLESIDLTTGRPAATFALPAGRVSVSDAVFSPHGTAAAFQLARARQDPRFTTGLPLPPADLAVLHLDTGSLNIVPGLELPPQTQTGLAFSGSWLLATVSEGDHGELLAWRQGLPGPVLVTRLPGPLVTAPPLLPALRSWRNG